MKNAVFTALAALGPAQRALGAYARRLRILAYHGLWTTPGHQFGDRLFMGPAQFEARMRALATGPYALLGLGEAVERLYAGTLPKWPVVVTIDDGWASTFSHMLPILERWRVPATCYVTSWHVERQVPIAGVAIRYLLEAAPAWPAAFDGVPLDRAAFEPTFAALNAHIRAEKGPQARLDRLLALAGALGVDPAPLLAGRQFHAMTADEVSEAAARGLDIQLHTHRHRGMGAANTIAREIADNAAVLAPLVGGGHKLAHFCYPSGNYIAGAGAALAPLGVKSATTTVAGLNTAATDRYFLKRFLDGRSVGEGEWRAYLSGGLELLPRRA